MTPLATPAAPAVPRLHAAGASTEFAEAQWMAHVAAGTAPACAHGTMLLFERLLRPPRSPPRVERFWGCSATRDGAECTALTPTPPPAPVPRARAWCVECARPAPAGQCECGHRVVRGAKLRRPTEFLRPAEASAGQAQFFFDDAAVKLILCQLERIGARRVACICTPRVHEAIAARHGRGRSVLLDIDPRLSHFFGPAEHATFNAFNGQFLPSMRHLEDDSPPFDAIVVDPPFGGCLAALACTIRRLSGGGGRELPLLFALPYFQRQQLAAVMPSLRMAEYRVGYTNHRSFRGGRPRSHRGSAVRIFTNLSLAEFRLPGKEGYRRCRLCDKWVHSSNVHCPICGVCTSIDGRPYRHCHRCGVCVKPGREHCDRCGRCQPPGHVCTGVLQSQGCLWCGADGHRWAQCPQRLGI